MADALPRRRLALVLVVAVLAATAIVALVVKSARGESVEGSPSPSASASADGGWTFVDNFDGPAGSLPDAATWGYDLGGGGWGNGELQTYTKSPANVRLDGAGHLVITALKTVVDGKTRYTSARLNTHGKMTMTYGTLQARIAVPSGHGLLPAFWQLGSDLDTVGYPASGEIDIVESPGQGLDYSTLHGPTITGQLWSIGTHRPAVSSGYHTYTLTRSATTITTRVDNVQTLQVNRSDLTVGQRWVFTKPFDVLLNVAVGGSFPGRPDATTPFPASMRVDYVRYRP